MDKFNALLVILIIVILFCIYKNSKEPFYIVKSCDTCGDMLSVDKKREIEIEKATRIWSINAPPY